MINVVIQHFPKIDFYKPFVPKLLPFTEFSVYFSTVMKIALVKTNWLILKNFLPTFYSNDAKSFVKTFFHQPNKDKVFGYTK
ncbi:MAG: hypothetical protein CSA42_00705 [Gammaproteobacteria bacterium]|nr:MAG: hypothetical protein CSA42_00705 [Gammaproteobacteria bacterium]